MLVENYPRGRLADSNKIHYSPSELQISNSRRGVRLSVSDIHPHASLVAAHCLSAQQLLLRLQDAQDWFYVLDVWSLEATLLDFTLENSKKYSLLVKDSRLWLYAQNTMLSALVSHDCAISAVSAHTHARGTLVFVACESGIIIWNVSETDEAQQLMHIQTKSVSVLEFHPSKQNSQNGGVLVCGGEKVVGFHISSDFKKYVPMDDSQWPDVSGIGRLDVLKVQADRDSFTVFASFKTQNQSTIAIFSIDNKFPTEIIKHTELIFDIQPITGTNGCDILSESQTRRVMPKQPDFATPYEPKPLLFTEWFPNAHLQFPFTPQYINAIREQRRACGGRLIFDMLLETFSLARNIAYPPTDIHQLQTSFRAILNAPCASTHAHCLDYEKFARRTKLPASFVLAMDGYLHLDNNNLQAAIKLLTHPQVDLDFAPEILNLLVKRGEYNMAMQIVDGQRVGTWTPKVAQAVLTALQHVDFTHALKHVDLYRSLLSPDSFTRLVEYQLQMPDKSGVHDLLAAEYSSEQEEQLLAYCAKTRHHNHLARDFMVAYLVQKHKYADAIHALEAQYDERGDQARIRDLQLISDDLRRVLGPVQRLVFDAQNGARLIRSKTVDMPLDYQVEKVLQNLATPNTSTADRAMQQDDTVESLKNTQVTSPFLQPPLTPNRQVKQRAQVLSATRSAESRLPKFNMTADSRSSSVSPTRERISALPSKEMFRNVLPPRQAQVGSGIMAGILGESPKQFFGKSPARKSPAHTNDRSPSPMGFVKDRSPSPMVSVRDRSPSPMIPLRDRSPSPIIAGKDRSPSPMMPVKEQVPSPRAMIKDRTPSPMYHVKESPMIHRKERSPSPMQQSPTRHSPLRAIISESHDQMQVDRESNQSPVSQTQDSMVVDNTDIFPDQPSAIEYPSLDMNAESMLINIPFSEEHVGHAWLDTPTVETDEQEHAPSTPASARQPEPAKRVNEPFGGKLLQKVASPTPARAIQPTIEVPTLANPLLVNRSPFVEQKKRPVRKLAAPPAHLIESFVAKTPVRTSTRLLKQLESGLRQSTPKITNKYGKGKTRSRVAGYSSSEEDVDMDQQGKGKAFDDEAVEKRQTSKRTPAKPLSRTMTPVRLERVGSEESVTDGIGDAHVSWTRSRSNTPKPDPEPATPIAPPSKSRKRVLAHPPKSLKNDMNLLKKREKEQDESPSISDKLDRRMMTRRLASQMKE